MSTASVRTLAHSAHATQKPVANERHKDGRPFSSLLEKEPGAKPTRVLLAQEMKSNESSSTLKQKGLFFLKDGKSDQNWMIPWFVWYAYVKVFTFVYKASDFVSANAKSIGETLRAETAKMAWSS